MAQRLLHRLLLTIFLPDRKKVMETLRARRMIRLLPERYDLNRPLVGGSVVPLPNGLLQICRFIYFCVCVCLFFLFPCFNPSRELAFCEYDKKTDNTHHSLIWICCFCFWKSEVTGVYWCRVGLSKLDTKKTGIQHTTKIPTGKKIQATIGMWKVSLVTFHHYHRVCSLMGPKYGWLITRIL